RKKEMLELKQMKATMMQEVNKDEKGGAVSAAGNEEDNDHHVENNLVNLLEESIQLPVVGLARGCSMISDLMEELTHVFGQGLSNSFYPVPQEAIGVGSAFAGWSPRAEDVVTHLPPGAARCRDGPEEIPCACGAAAKLQEGAAGGGYAVSSITLRRKQDPSLLHSLCTGSYLHVEKTAHKDEESFMAEMISGVRQGDSDVFVGSQPTAAGIPSTTCLEIYAVAEAKFFRHLCRQAPQDTWHCECLQLLIHSLTGS
ncbi:hypothetical protein IHE44_0006655, partial [Lamprotornis superbus]